MTSDNLKFRAEFLSTKNKTNYLIVAQGQSCSIFISFLQQKLTKLQHFKIRQISSAHSVQIVQMAMMQSY